MPKRSQQKPQHGTTLILKWLLTWLSNRYETMSKFVQASLPLSFFLDVGFFLIFDPFLATQGGHKNNGHGRYGHFSWPRGRYGYFFKKKRIL